MVKLIFIVLLVLLSGCKSRKVVVVRNTSTNPLVMFVSQRDSVRSIYGISLVDLKVEKVLPDTFDNVYELKFSPDGEVAFFKTAKFEGTVGAGFFKIEKPKVFLFDVSTGEIELLKSFGDSWSVKIRWVGEDTAEVIQITGGYQVDKPFVETIYGYLKDGELIYKRVNKYNWKNNEFPPERLDLRLNSPVLGYSVRILKDTIAGIYRIYMVEPHNRYEIFETKWKPEQVDWSTDGRFVVFRVVNITPEAVESDTVKTGEIYFFDTVKRNLFRIDSGHGLFNFRFIDDTRIIYDKGFESDSELYLYDLLNRSVKRLTKDKFPDGVLGIPKIFGFSA